MIDGKRCNDARTCDVNDFERVDYLVRKLRNMTLSTFNIDRRKDAYTVAYGSICDLCREAGRIEEVYEQILEDGVEMRKKTI